MQIIVPGKKRTESQEEKMLVEINSIGIASTTIPDEVGNATISGTNGLGNGVMQIQRQGATCRLPGEG